MEDFLLHADAVDLDAVGAAQVADGPVAVFEHQLAVQAGNVGEAHANITRFPPANGQGRPNQGNGVSAPNRNELPVAWLTHSNQLRPRGGRSKARSCLAKMIRIQNSTGN